MEVVQRGIERSFTCDDLNCRREIIVYVDLQISGHSETHLINLEERGRCLLCGKVNRHGLVCTVVSDEAG